MSGTGPPSAMTTAPPTAAARGAGLSGLFVTEWCRLFRRRAVMIMILLAVAASGIVLLVLAANTTQPTEAQRATARHELAAELERRDSLIAQCRAGELPRQSCDLGSPPTEDDWLPYGFSFAREAEGMLYIAAVVLGLLGFFVGASFVGAEWTSGGMLNLLLWHPSRVRVVAVKLAAVLAGMAAVGVAYLTAWLAAGALVGTAIGTIGHVTPGEATSLALLAVRVLVLAAAMTAVGFAIASLGRRTVAAPGAAIGYLVVYEIGSLVLAALMRMQDQKELRLSLHAVSWLQGGWNEIWRTNSAGDYVTTGRYEVTLATSGAVLAAVVLALVGAALLSAHRRDVS